jgi:predicted nucleic acid-binding protein
VSPIYLLDSSVLIPLVAAEHVHHERATAWAAAISRFAVCPVVEGAVVRFAVRLGARATDVQEALRLVRSRAGFEFWPDSISYVDVDPAQVRGHGQVTDTYLAGLAVSNGGILATLDEGLAADYPESAFLLPA